MTKKIALQIDSEILKIGIHQILNELKIYEISELDDIKQIQEQAINFDLLLFDNKSLCDVNIKKIQIIEETQIPIIFYHSLVTTKVSKEELLEAVDKTLRSYLYVEKRVKQFKEEQRNKFNKLKKLTTREKVLIEEIIKGKTNKEISSVLYISEKTVKNNLTELYKKLEIKNRRELEKKYKNLLTMNKWDGNIY